MDQKISKLGSVEHPLMVCRDCLGMQPPAHFGCRVGPGVLMLRAFLMLLLHRRGCWECCHSNALRNTAGRRRWSARETVEKFKSVYSVMYFPKQSKFLEITLKSRTGRISLKHR